MEKDERPLFGDVGEDLARYRVRGKRFARPGPNWSARELLLFKKANTKLSLFS